MWCSCTEMMGTPRFVFRMALLISVLFATFVFLLYKDHFLLAYDSLVSRALKNNASRENTRTVVTTGDSADDMGRLSDLVSKIKFELQPKGVQGRARVKLIILTYMRSGSTFTADVFDHHPDVYYTYEPLTSVSRFFATGLQHVMLMDFRSLLFDRTKTQTTFNQTKVVNHFFRSFLNCNFLDLDPYVLTQSHMKHSLDTLPFYECAAATVAQKHVLNVLRCLPLMYGPCRKAEVTAVKTIRARMSQVVEIVKRDPKVKVIHLVRDPRPTLVSQMIYSAFKQRRFDAAAEEHCRRVLDDLNTAQSLLASLRDNDNKRRLLTIRYEDLAFQPTKLAERLLAFAGLSMTDMLREYVWNITSAGNPDSCSFCTTREDSKAAAVRWRSNAGFLFMKAVEQRCGEVLNRFGYLPLNTEQKLRNLSVPSYVEDFSRFPELWLD